jgi:hypothetical protein
MAIECEVVPRPGATPAELKALGSALLRWYVRECRGDGIAHSVDTEALIELLNGRPPAPRVPRAAPACVPPGVREPAEPGWLNGYELRVPSLDRLRDAIAGARRPAALLRVRDGKCDRCRAVASLRQHLPASLIDDVFVDGRSWGSEE